MTGVRHFLAVLTIFAVLNGLFHLVNWLAKFEVLGVIMFLAIFIGLIVLGFKFVAGIK